MIQRSWLVLLILLSTINAVAQKDISWDIKTGDKVAQEVEKSIGLITHPGGEAVVKRVGERLVSQLETNPYQFTFQIVDQPEPNAFAVPGGHVYVSRGLLVLLQNEDELAGVLGHEISHVIRRHAAKQQQKSIVPSILAAPGVLLGSTIGGSLGDRVAAPLLGAGRIMIASYGRKQETEADELGIVLAAKAGYDPLKLGDILNRIERWVESETGKATRFSLLNDHPLTPEREKNIALKAKGVTIQQQPAVFTPASFLESFNAVTLGANPAHGVFNENVFLHPSLRIFWELPAKWNYVNESNTAGGGKDKDLLLVTIAGKDRQLDTLINNFVNGYYAKTRKQPVSDKKLSLPGRSASEIILPGSQPNTVVYTVWFKKDQHTFLIMGLGNASLVETFRTSTLTFRDLTPADQAAIHVQELEVIKAKGSETCTSLSTAYAPAKLLAIVNNTSEQSIFAAGSLIKTIQRKPFIP